MLMRRNPESNKGFTSSGSRVPLVVNSTDSTPGVATKSRIASTTPGRINGSPPVTRKRLKPSPVVARTMASSSS